MTDTREIVLHGELARRYGKHHRFAVASAAEAVRALSANYKGFEQHLTRSEARGVGYQVWAGGENLGEDDLARHSAGRIYISPVVMGSKRAGALQTIIGAALVVVGVVLLFTPAAPVAPYLLEAGSAMMLGGIIQMLSPPPQLDQDQNRLQSAFFDGPVNTTAQGNPVPVGFGRMIVGSATISAGISIDDELPTSPAPDGSGWSAPAKIGRGRFGDPGGAYLQVP